MPDYVIVNSGDRKENNTVSSVYHQSYSQIENPQKQMLLIHGWGMNSGIWSDLVPRLVNQFPDYLITLVDLPGYGKSAALKSTASSLAMAQALRPLLKETFATGLIEKNILIGWSMGGLVAIELATILSDCIQQLLLVSTSPRFVQTDDWPDAVEAHVFQEFSNSLQQDHRITLQRFLAIQSLGSPTAKQDIKKIQRQLSLQGEADPRALQQGLQILLNEDKRPQLAALSMPVSLIAGSKDSLIKISALEHLAQTADFSLYTMNAGHAPFISHPEQFVEILLQAL